MSRKRETRYLIQFPPNYWTANKGPKFYLHYEEMVELFSAGMHKEHGNEALESMKQRAYEIFKTLPETDY